MKLLTSVVLLLPNVDPAMNVLTVMGRSGLEYQFQWSPEHGQHARVYGPFDAQAEIERLAEEEKDLANAILPQGWEFHREYVFEEGEEVSHEGTKARRGEEEAREVALLLRRAILRLWMRVNSGAAHVSFTEEDKKDEKALLAGPVEAVFERFGIRMPEWVKAQERLDEAQETGGIEVSHEGTKARSGTEAVASAIVKPKRVRKTRAKKMAATVV